VPSGSGVRWRQPPGPGNALGRVKLVMGNPYAIYLHDTNAKHLFDVKARAYSHGCIRTEDAVGFAETLLQGTEWDRARIDATLASKKSVQANIAAPVPVYIVYFTVATTTDKDGYLSYTDLYTRDPTALLALNDKPLPPKPVKAAAGAAKPGAKPAVAKAGAKPAAKPAVAAAKKPQVAAAR
jgi:murein L,D-transpeptidase YcbB/YkuD